MRRKILEAIAMTALMLTVLSGCKTTGGNDFSDEEYLWEKWKVSTNNISIIEVKF